MMKKLIALTALAGLVAAGCASKENRGGSFDNQSDYGTGTNMTTSPNTASGSLNRDTANSPNTGTGNSAGTTTEQSTPNSSNNSSSNSNSSTNPNSANP